MITGVNGRRLAFAYGLRRSMWMRVATEAGVAPTRISFVAAMDFVGTALRPRRAVSWLVEHSEAHDSFVAPRRLRAYVARAMVAGLTVLVVDDNEGNRGLAKATLEDEGYDVVLAEDGEAGIAAFEQEQPQCVLLDIQMPGMDGVAACQRIRELRGGASVAIVLVTAQHDVGLLDQAMAAGGDDFLTKPFRPSELGVRIQAALRIRSIVRERDELYELTKRQRDDARVNEERFRTLVMTSSALV